MADLNSLMIFARVVEAKSFSKAAHLLKMPTSTVSRRVAELQEQLGVRLIERSTRNLRLTDVGAEIFEQAQHSSEICEAVENIASTMCRPFQGNCGSQRRRASRTHFLLHSSGAFQTSYPNVRGGPLARAGGPEVIQHMSRCPTSCQTRACFPGKKPCCLTEEKYVGCAF